MREMQAALLAIGIEASLGSLHSEELDVVSRFVQNRQKAKTDSLERRKKVWGFFAAQNNHSPLN